MPEQNLWCGDCLDLLPKVPDNSVQCFFCDLPYGMTSHRWDVPIHLPSLWKELHRAGKDDCVYAFTASFLFAIELYKSNPRDFRYECTIVKSQHSNPLCSGYRHLPKHELLLVFYRKKPKWRRDVYHRKLDLSGVFKGAQYEPSLPTTIIHSNTNDAKSKHPCRKDPKMIEYLLRYWCDPGDTVCDPTMGSGATGEAARKLGLSFTGIEKDADIYMRAVESLTPPPQGL